MRHKICDRCGWIMPARYSVKVGTRYSLDSGKVSYSIYECRQCFFSHSFMPLRINENEKNFT